MRLAPRQTAAQLDERDERVSTRELRQSPAPLMTVYNFVWAQIGNWMAAFAQSPAVATVDTVVNVRKDGSPIIDFLGRGCTSTTIPVAAGALRNQRRHFLWTCCTVLVVTYGRLLDRVTFSISDGDTGFKKAEHSLATLADFTVGTCSFHKLFLWLVRSVTPKQGLPRLSDTFSDSLVIALMAIRDSTFSPPEVASAITVLRRAVVAAGLEE